MAGKYFRVLFQQDGEQIGQHARRTVMVAIFKRFDDRYQIPRPEYMGCLAGIIQVDMYLSVDNFVLHGCYTSSVMFIR